MEGLDYEVLEEAAAILRRRWPEARPLAGLILGSGWGEVIKGLEARDSVPYGEIPGLGASGIKGHAGKLAWATAGNVELLVFQGRRHWYEGVGWTPIALPVFALKSMGASYALITNAAGGIKEGMHPGDLMLLSDHINLMGRNPLVGPHDSRWGPRYPDMSFLYDRGLRDLARTVASEQGLGLHEGVYCAVSGPSFETPAEIRMLKALGADAVGMSTVPEAILANAAGLKVASLSCITNYAAGIGKEALTHEEVIETTDKAMPGMRGLIGKFCERLSQVK